jgi:hypothetical protein
MRTACTAGRELQSRKPLGMNQKRLKGKPTRAHHDLYLALGSEGGRRSNVWCFWQSAVCILHLMLAPTSKATPPAHGLCLPEITSDLGKGGGPPNRFRWLLLEGLGALLSILPALLGSRTRFLFHSLSGACCLHQAPIRRGQLHHQPRTPMPQHAFAV